MRIGKPIDCIECGAPKIALHPNRKHCDECYRRMRIALSTERQKEAMKDPIKHGYAVYQQIVARREWRAARKRVLKNPDAIEAAVVENLRSLGIGGDDGS